MTGTHSPTSSAPSHRTLFAVGALAVVGIIAAKNPIIFVLLLTDGLLAAGILTAAGLGGFALLPLIRLGGLELRWQVLLGAGLGIGLLANLVLGLGLLEVLDHRVWMGVLIAAAVFGGARAARLYASARPTGAKSPIDARPDRSTSLGRFRWLWLLACPFLAMTILVASVPPGYLWAEEGNGYDVLEYHLQMPKEYFEAGRVQYAPHNVYANFPANVEMLYLLGMVLVGDPIDAAITCKMLNAGLAVLTAAAAWLIGRQRSPLAGLVTASATASVGWLTYLSGVAYVENGMLLFGLLAVASLLRAIDEPKNKYRWAAVSGLFAGLAFGCKYPAVVLIGLPLAIGWALAIRGGPRPRLIALGVYAIAHVAAFAPWGLKNLAMTGNPVFPLAGQYSSQDPPGWGRAEAEHFAAAHAPAPDERTLGSRLTSFWRNVLADYDERTGLKLRFGAAIWILAGWAISDRRQRAVTVCGTVLLVQVAVWLFGTHLYARFAVPLVLPLIGLVAWLPLERSHTRRFVIGVLVGGTALSSAAVGRLYLQHMCPSGQRLDLEGATAFFTTGGGLGHDHLGVINGELPVESQILMLGDAKAFYFRRQVDYCVVFNRDPFVEQVRRSDSSTETVDWLVRQGYTHVLVNWAEISRLRHSRYGFPAEITPRLFDRLCQLGLRRTDVFTSATGRPYAELFQLDAAGS